MLTIIGVIVGFVMGITGAGGALVAIPLFMEFLHMNLREASVYSLIAVVIASLSNFYYQRKYADISLAIGFVLSSAAGSLISGPYKSLIPETWIAILLGLIALYSLYSVWLPKKYINSTNQEKSHPFKTLVVGLTLGILTTFTGLGGGVLMMPILMRIYKFHQDKAVATSLVVVGFSSLISFLIQVKGGYFFKMSFDLLGLIAGIFVTSYVLKLLTKKISPKTFENLRKLVFTFVVFLSLGKIFF
jgi:uncharacterized membrane protein YfcA